MSRRYCSVCRAAHHNPHEGLCDKHLAESEAAEWSKARQDREEKEAFLNQTDEEKWSDMYDFMREHGFNKRGW